MAPKNRTEFLGVPLGPFNDSHVKADGGVGIDFTSLSAWEAARQGDLTASGFIERAIVLGSGNVGVVTLAGWTTDKHYFPMIVAQDGHEAGSRFRTDGAYIQNSAANECILVNTLSMYWIEGLTIEQDNGTYESIETSNCRSGVITKNFIVGTPDTAEAGNIKMDGDSSGKSRQYCINNVVYNVRSTGRGAINGIGASTDIFKIYNNTVVNCKNGFSQLFNVAGESRNNYYHRMHEVYSTNSDIYDGVSNTNHDVDATSTSESDRADLTEILPSGNNSIFVDYDNLDFTLVYNLHNPDVILMRSSGIILNDENLPGAHGPTFTVMAEDVHSEERPEGSSSPAPGPGNISLGADQPYVDEGPFFIGGFLLAELGGTASGILGGYLLADPPFSNTASGFLGGYLLGTSLAHAFGSAILGGYTEGAGGIEAPVSIGGYLDAFPKTLAGVFFLGGAASGLNQNTAFVGGFSFGEPVSQEFAETHARVLAKASDTSTIDQKLEIDALVIFKQRSNEDFYAKFIIADTANSEFNAKIDIDKFKIPPTVTITNVAVSGGGLIPSGLVTVTASGSLGDGDEFISSYIDFGEPVLPDGKGALNGSISGFNGPSPWTASHSYSSSGIYTIVARGQDNLGMVGSDVYQLNLASGLIAGIDYPLISISGTPRFGEVPPSLQVDFTLSTSGSIVIQSPADPNLHWNFGNREKSQRRNPLTFYNSPGLYAPICRFRYVRPDGNVVYVSDSLLIGFSN